LVSPYRALEGDHKVLVAPDSVIFRVVALCNGETSDQKGVDTTCNGETSKHKVLVTLWERITRDRDHASAKSNRSEPYLSDLGLKTFK